MAVDLMVLFAGMSAMSAIVQAIKAALEMKNLVLQDFERIVAEAKKKALADKGRAKEAAKKMQLDQGMLDTFNRKIKESTDKFNRDFAAGKNPSDWAKATDILKSDLCAILREVKKVNRGILPDEWYDLWVQNQCS